MSFRQRQKYCGAFCTPVVDAEQKTLENGCIVCQTADQSDKVLPDSKLFDLEYQLKAGINLEEVNSKIFSPKSIDAFRVISLFKSDTVKPTNKDTSYED